MCIFLVPASAAEAPGTPDADATTAAAALLPVAPLLRPVIPKPRPPKDQRILGVIPDYQTVNDCSQPVEPLTPRQKWNMFLKQTADPFNVASAAMAAGFSQAGNETPKYGEGGAAYAERFGAAMADFATQGFFSGVALATLFRQDPRYFRKGPESGVFRRIAYSVSRIAITRQDSGRPAFNISSVLGMMLGIAASNAYYPPSSVRASVMLGRLDTSLSGSVMGNLLSEFWPDIQRKVFHRKQRD